MNSLRRLPIAFRGGLLLLLTLVVTPVALSAQTAADDSLAIRQLRHAIGTWDVITEFLQPDGSVARSVPGTYRFEWVVPDRVVAGRSDQPSLGQSAGILFYLNSARHQIEMVSVGADGRLWVMTGPSGGETRHTGEYQTQGGTTGQLRFTRYNVMPDAFESRMEWTQDGGKTWVPGNHQTFRRSTGQGQDPALPGEVRVVDPTSGAPLNAAQLASRLAAADYVLLGELHDNSWHHRVRGQLIRSAAIRPAVVFEQFAASEAPLPAPAAGQGMEAWLDAGGFDRASWKWPLHAPVVEAAMARAREIRGSNVSREELRGVVRGGSAAAPLPLRALMEAVPLDDQARAALDRELVDGHCGQLPEQMVPGMRAAQEIRDAAMTRALLAAAESGGPAWLIAGNGHVRKDIAVPRMLRAVAPGKRVVAVGLVETGPDGGPRNSEELSRYDLVILTPAAERPDPCASFRMAPPPPPPATLP